MVGAGHPRERQAEPSARASWSGACDRSSRSRAKAPGLGGNACCRPSGPVSRAGLAVFGLPAHQSADPAARVRERESTANDPSRGAGRRAQEQDTSDACGSASFNPGSGRSLPRPRARRPRGWVGRLWHRRITHPAPSEGRSGSMVSFPFGAAIGTRGRWFGGRYSSCRTKQRPREAEELNRTTSRRPRSGTPRGELRALLQKDGQHVRPSTAQRNLSQANMSRAGTSEVKVSPRMMPLTS